MIFMKKSWIAIIVVLAALVVCRDRCLSKKIEEIVALEKKIKSELKP